MKHAKPAHTDQRDLAALAAAPEGQTLLRLVEAEMTGEIRAALEQVRLGRDVPHGLMHRASAFEDVLSMVRDSVTRIKDRGQL